MQVLCIENGTLQPGHAVKLIPKKGEIYNSIRIEPVGYVYKNLDMWHRLKELNPLDAAHISLFIELPSQEGQSFKKEETVEIPQKLQPFYAQL